MTPIQRTPHFDIHCSHCDGHLAQVSENNSDFKIEDYPLNPELSKLQTLSMVGNVDLCFSENVDVASVGIDGCVRAAIAKSHCHLCGETSFVIQVLTSPVGLRFGADAFDGTFAYDTGELYISNVATLSSSDMFAAVLTEVGIQKVNSVSFDDSDYPYWLIQFFGGFTSQQSALNSIEEIVLIAHQKQVDVEASMEANVLMEKCPVVSLPLAATDKQKRPTYLAG